MIIFGTGTKTLGTKKLQLENCPNCEANNLHITCVAKYAHLFWIPVFPTERHAFPKCHNCGQEPNITNQKTIDKIKAEKKKFSYPFYLYSGIGVIALLISFAFYSSYQHDKEVAENLKNLQTNDVIVFKSTITKEEYYYCRVIQIRSDTIIYNVSNYSFQGGTPDEDTYRNDKGKHLDFFNTQDSLYFTQKEIDSLYEVEEIYDLYRKKQ